MTLTNIQPKSILSRLEGDLRHFDGIIGDMSAKSANSSMPMILVPWKIKVAFGLQPPKNPLLADGVNGLQPHMPQVMPIPENQPGPVQPPNPVPPQPPPQQPPPQGLLDHLQSGANTLTQGMRAMGGPIGALGQLGQGALDLGRDVGHHPMVPAVQQAGEQIAPNIPRVLGVPGAEAVPNHIANGVQMAGQAINNLPNQMLQGAEGVGRDVGGALEGVRQDISNAVRPNLPNAIPEWMGGNAQVPEQSQIPQGGVSNVAERVLAHNPEFRDPAAATAAGTNNLKRQLPPQQQNQPGFMEHLQRFWTSLGPRPGDFSIGGLSVQQLLIAAGLSLGAVSLFGMLTGNQTIGGATGGLLGLGGLGLAAYGSGLFDSNSYLRRMMSGQSQTPQTRTPTPLASGPGGFYGRSQRALGSRPSNQSPQNPQGGAPAQPPLVTPQQSQQVVGALRSGQFEPVAPIIQRVIGANPERLNEFLSVGPLAVSYGLQSALREQTGDNTVTVSMNEARRLQEWVRANQARFTQPQTPPRP